MLTRSIIISQFLMKMTTTKRNRRRCSALPCSWKAFPRIQNLSYHTIKGEKIRGLLIDPGAASGFVGSETLRDLMAWCISEDKREDQNNFSGRYLRRIRPNAGRGLIEVVHCKPAKFIKRRCTGRCWIVMPSAGWKPNSSSTISSRFQCWFQNGDAFLTIHRPEMLGPDGQTILLRLLLTDVGHYLLRSGAAQYSQQAEVHASHSAFVPAVKAQTSQPLTIWFAFKIWNSQ